MSSSCSQCCRAYFCCCCLGPSVKDTKYAQVRYSTVQRVEPDGNQSSNSLLDHMDKLFSFPQQPSITTIHPQMFHKEIQDPVVQQPTVEYERQFSSQSATGVDYSRYVAGGSSTEQAIAAADSKPKKRSRTLFRSLSADSAVSSESPVNSKRKSPPSIENDSPWVLGLPIIEENPLTGQSNKPMLQFSLHYDIQQSTLMVHLHNASNLPAKDRQGTSDPFVVLHLTPNKEETFQSAIIYRTLNPVFDQSFQFKRLTPDDIRRQTLILRIYDHDRFTRNDSIGMVALPLQNADLYGVVMRMIVQDDEKPQLRGKVLITLSYDPQLSLLKGIVLKAADLKKQDIVGQADPYIKIYFMYKGKRKKKWKSTVKKNTLTPIFNESFLFDMSRDTNISDVHLEVFLMDYDRLSRNDVIGVVILGEKSDHMTGQKHWMDMLQSPKQSISQWHSVAPPSFENLK